MKTKNIILITFLLVGIAAMAQPLPPSSPSGNQVPVGQLIGLLLLAGGVFFVKRKKNKQ